MILNDRIALKDGYCLFSLRLIAKVVTKRKQVEQNITQSKSRKSVSWTVERRLRIFQGIVYYISPSVIATFITPLFFSRCYYRLFTFCVFTCTQNTAKQLKNRRNKASQRKFSPWYRKTDIWLKEIQLRSIRCHLPSGGGVGIQTATL